MIRVNYKYMEKQTHSSNIQQVTSKGSGIAAPTTLRFGIRRRMRMQCRSESVFSIYGLIVIRNISS